MTSQNYVRGMKRAVNGKPPPKPKPKLPDYTDTEPLKDDNGDPIWPVPVSDLTKARDFIKKWYFYTYLDR